MPGNAYGVEKTLGDFQQVDGHFLNQTDGTQGFAGNKPNLQPPHQLEPGAPQKNQK